MEDGRPTRYVRCRACGTVYASPRSARSVRYAWLDERFGIGANAFENAAGRRPALEQEAVLIQRYVSGGRVLDVGCDLGDFFRWFSGPGWERYGVEVSSSAAAYASRTYGAQVYAGTLEQAAYRSAFFDVITLLDVLYYLDNPKADLREVVRVLKPAGFLAVEIPGQAYVLWRSRGPLCWLLERRWSRLRTDSAYLFFPRPAGLKDLLEWIGFRIVAWHVVPSPEQPDLVRKQLSRAYFSTVSAVCGGYFRALTFVPKYLCLARLQG